MRNILVGVGGIALCAALVFFLTGATKKDVIHYGCETEIQPVEGAPGQYLCKFVIRDLATDTVLSTPMIVCLKGREAQIEVKSKDIKDGIFAQVLVGDSGVELNYSTKLVQDSKTVFAQSAKIKLSD